MKERTSRLRAIRTIIRNQRISSQEELLHHLQKEGYGVTQATLSRDLKFLKVGKVSQGIDGYFYTMPSEEERRETERSYILDFQRGYVGIEFSANLGVIRTLIGHANSLALAMDAMHFETLIGTIAGDDTVLIILREGFAQEDFFTELRTRIPDFQE